ncbi:MAG: ABC transporter ATP-binding protein [Alphaproteobacteria bacterium]
MLEIRNIETFYGTSQVLFGISLEVRPGEIVGLLGRNGMGKTTTVRSIMALTPPARGTVRIDGVDMAGKPAHQIARAGLGLVPEGRQIFPNLTTQENLVATMRTGGEWGLTDIYDRFPVLEARRNTMGQHLSGGEQQMLAISRALLTAPRILILDEATEGLAPAIRDIIWQTIVDARARGLGVLVIDRDLDQMQAHADRVVILEKGEVVWTGSGADVADNRDLVEGFLSV